jgi:NAD(P) transhydrogenase subunit alpha
MDDEIVKNMAIAHEGEVTWKPPESRPAPPSAAQPAATAAQEPKLTDTDAVEQSDCSSCWDEYNWVLLIALLTATFILIAISSSSTVTQLFMSFILAICIGNMLIWNVAPALHTPLMSVTNAISGIIIIGAMLLLQGVDGVIDVASSLAILGVFFAAINVVGGFVVTQRMLNMFRKD